MESVCSKDMCSGCNACVDICAKKAISIQDDLNAYNAIIDPVLCVNCNACRKVCPNLVFPAVKKPIYWMQGWSVDTEDREKATSGGAATTLAKYFVSTGGVVFSCVFQNGEFRFKAAETASEVDDFTGSKYVKSNPIGLHKTVRRLLRDGRRVLVIGLPCQIGGLKKFCGDAENLYTVDLICHGTPSPRLLEMYLMSRKHSLKDMAFIGFRRKHTFRILDSEGLLEEKKYLDFYSHLFLNGITYTEGCYNCQYARFERVSDITLGDSWGSQLDMEEQKKGISLLLAQTDKGINLIKRAPLTLKEVDIESAINNNGQLRHPSEKKPIRKAFFCAIKKGIGFNLAFSLCYPKKFVKWSILHVLNMKK